ncbi:MAG: MFS transporter, partial [Dehalococcoidales bacterium]
MPDEHIIEPYQERYRWVILFLVWLLYAAFGLVSRSVAPLVTPILKDLNMSYSQMGIILGSWQLTYIIVAIIAGAIIDKWGIRKSLFIGTVIIGLSAALRYFPSGFGTFLLVVAIFGIGGPLISIGAPKTISSWFRGKGRGTAVGIYTTGPWIGGLIAL